MSDDADMKEAAGFAGLSYERFRKVWPSLVRRLAFPAPWRDEAPYRWERSRLVAWKAARTGQIRDRILSAPAANDDHPDAPPSPVRKGRAAAGRARCINRMRAIP